MKKLSFLLVTLTALTVLSLTGCASAHVKSGTAHHLTAHGIALPPGWSAILPNINNSANNNQVNQITFTTTGTNGVGFFSPRPLVFVAFDESWTDDSRGGGTFLLTDPKASQLNFEHTNQTALGGGRVTQVGEIDSTITTNAVAMVTAVGKAAGDIAAEIIKQTTPVGAASGAAAAVVPAAK